MTGFKKRFCEVSLEYDLGLGQKVVYRNLQKQHLKDWTCFCCQMGNIAIHVQETLHEICYVLYAYF